MEDINLILHFENKRLASLWVGPSGRITESGPVDISMVQILW